MQANIPLLTREVLTQGPVAKSGLNNIQVTEENVRVALSKLSPSAAPGPDGVQANCYKMGGSKMVNFLVNLFQKSLDQADVPDNNLIALIAPIYKGGDRSLPKNYRPVALTSHLSKTLERVIRLELVQYIESLGLLDQGQHGCRPGQSTLSQLIIQYDWILDQLLEGKNVDLIFLDFEKAFDKVDIGLLLTKLRDLGTSGALGAWIGKFMMGRSQAVRVGSTISQVGIC